MANHDLQEAELALTGSRQTYPMKVAGNTATVEVFRLMERQLTWTVTATTTSDKASEHGTVSC